MLNPVVSLRHYERQLYGGVTLLLFWEDWTKYCAFPWIWTYDAIGVIRWLCSLGHFADFEDGVSRLGWLLPDEKQEGSNGDFNAGFLKLLFPRACEQMWSRDIIHAGGDGLGMTAISPRPDWELGPALASTTALSSPGVCSDCWSGPVTGL